MKTITIPAVIGAPEKVIELPYYFKQRDFYAALLTPFKGILVQLNEFTASISLSDYQSSIMPFFAEWAKSPHESISVSVFNSAFQEAQEHLQQEYNSLCEIELTEPDDLSENQGCDQLHADKDFNVSLIADSPKD